MEKAPSSPGAPTSPARTAQLAQGCCKSSPHCTPSVGQGSEEQPQPSREEVDPCKAYRVSLCKGYHRQAGLGGESSRDDALIANTTKPLHLGAAFWWPHEGKMLHCLPWAFQNLPVHRLCCGT